MTELALTAYLTRKEAADYLRYSLTTFDRHVRAFKIPRYGPGRNRFYREDLDKFMNNPQCFKAERRVKQRRQGWTPVVI
ncbi:MAG: hypothetical protein PWQ57_3122 [Desulfovibrionales bacterium]|nr:hypothetical protein [Desulfovibrionales bacterium]